MKREAFLKAKLMRRLHEQLPAFVCQRHEDRFQHGWPDLSVSGCARTSFWEVKHADPQWHGSGRQELMMLRLAASSFYARYVFFHEKRGIKRTLIVHPKHVTELEPESWTPGFDMNWLVEQIKGVHTA